MLREVQNTIRAHELLPKGAKVLVAVSGGADSVCLLHVLAKLARQYDVQIEVAHLNHLLRPEAGADSEFVEALAGTLAVPCHVGKARVKQTAKRRGISLEMAAREARYAFFARTARRCGATILATAHTANDQAETLLLRLARGTGPSGMAGIPILSSQGKLSVIRPLLETSRRQVVYFLRTHHLAWREDASNQDMAFLRNRVRHQLLPLMETCLNPEVGKALCRTAAVFRDEEAWTGRLVTEAATRCTRGREIDVAALRAEPVALQRRVLHKWLFGARVSAESITFEHIEAIRGLCRSSRGTRLHILEGERAVERVYDRLRWRVPGQTADAFRFAVSRRGATTHPGDAFTVHVKLATGILRDRTDQPGHLPAGGSLSAARAGRKRLICRSWQPGDRMRPLGAEGSRKLQDIFVDAKLPASKRGHVPLFECDGEIVWIPGYRIAEGWQLSHEDEKAIHIQITPRRWSRV